METHIPLPTFSLRKCHGGDAPSPNPYPTTKSLTKSFKPGTMYNMLYSKDETFPNLTIVDKTNLQPGELIHMYLAF